MRLPTLVAERLKRCPALACVLILAGAGAAQAQEPAETLYAVARQKVQQQDIIKSAQLGFGIKRIAFSDLPTQGAILIGFDVQLSKFNSDEIVHALRPVYATEKGEIATNEFGDFGIKPGAKKNAALTRTLRIKAPQGFAVAGITVRRGLYIDGLKLTYNAFKAHGLDAEQVASSAWIGNDKRAQSEKTIGNNGMPIVGIFGNRDDQRVLALGIFQIAAPVVAAAPKVAQRPANVKEPAFARDKAPEAKPAADVPAEPEDAEKKDAVEKVDPKLADKEPGEHRSLWLPIAIFGVVSMMVFAGCWLVMGGKRNGKRPAKSKRHPEARKEGRKMPPPIPMDDHPDGDRAAASCTSPIPDDPEVIATGICVLEKSGVSPGAYSENAPMDPSPSRSIDDSLREMPSIARTQPPYFHARAVFALKINRFYRVYVLPEMLLFLDAGPEKKNGFAQGVGVAGAAAGGILGAVVGSAIGSLIDQARQDSLEMRLKALDYADTDQLMRMTAEGAPNFRVAVEDLEDARIEPTSVWHSMQYLGTQYIGLFCFRHPDHGEFTLQIPSLNDMKIALAELSQVFGDHLEVKVELDRHSWQYVARK